MQSLEEASFKVNRVGICTRSSGPCMDCHTTQEEQSTELRCFLPGKQGWNMVKKLVGPCINYHNTQEEYTTDLSRCLLSGKQGWNMDKKLRSLHGLSHCSIGTEYRA